ncbi:MAG: glycosyltransferase family 39 protein [Patescibacteria group bacterium]
MISPFFIINKIKDFVKSDRHLSILIVCLVIFAVASALMFGHTIGGDAISYIDAGHVLGGASIDTQEAPPDFIFQRILTTFLGVEIVNGLSVLFGNISVGWFIWDVFLYFCINIIFYKLLLKIFRSHTTALLGTLFFASNYAMVTAGLGNFMDIGGWSFYVFSIYFLWKYMESGNRRELITSALFISVGGFFKENAFMAYIPMFFILLYENRHSFISFLKKIIVPTVIITVPAMIHHLDVYLAYDYKYTRWIEINRTTYFYRSRILEYIKSFGSLLNFLAPISFLGFFAFFGLKKDLKIDAKRLIFIASVFISSIPPILWPGITQRVLFMVVPGLTILACFFIKKYEKYWYAFVPILALYILSSFFMDSFILKAVNLPF